MVVVFFIKMMKNAQNCSEDSEAFSAAKMDPRGEVGPPRIDFVPWVGVKLAPKGKDALFTPPFF
jgi:hypothetical protein